MRQATIEKQMNSKHDGVQKIYRFDNGYGASVINSEHSYGGNSGLWELAVLKFKGKSNYNYSLVFDTRITDGVIGALEDSEVDALLTWIESIISV